jgi:hypothetical protein
MYPPVSVPTHQAGARGSVLDSWFIAMFTDAYPDP